MIMPDGTKAGVNPYLPSWEYIPDAEPHVFGDRVYIYGSHDRFNSHMYCLNDYVSWSAPVDDLRDWRYEGVMFRRTDDPANVDDTACLFAPDATQGPDGRYYLYYVLNNKPCVSVAVSDVPQGPFTFVDYVHDEAGGILGLREGDEPQFDPAVLTEGELTYLYTGFCAVGDKSRSGPMVTVLAKDMVTIIEDVKFIMPSEPYSKGSGYEGHEFFEAPSIRKLDGRYYFVYSSIKMYELCYAVSDSPTDGFTYGGVLISNNDIGIDSYKPAAKPMFYGGNNHGGLEEFNGQLYIFYHRHTNGSNYSRQTCAEKVEMDAEGHIPQDEMSSCGLNGGPLAGKGEIPSYIACNLFCDVDNPYTGGMGRNGLWLDAVHPILTQDGGDGDEEQGYILNMTDSATAGFKYFELENVRSVSVRTRGYGKGVFEVRTAWDGEVLGEIPVKFSNVWEDNAVDCRLPDGVHAIYLTFRGEGNLALHSFILE